MNGTATRQESTSFMNDSFFGKSNMDKTKECTILSMMRNRREMLKDDLQEAKIKFADAALDKDNWLGKYEREMACKVLEGQISLLNMMEKEIEEMPTVMVS